MKWTLLIVCMVLVMACESQNTKSQETPPQENNKEVQAKPAAKPQQTSKSRVNYIKDTSRPLAEINQVYPYDIEMKRPDGSLTRSDQILKKSKKPKILLFWLTTCFPCKMQMAKMQETYEAFEKETGIEMIAISVDFQKNFEKYQVMVDEKKWPWETYHDWNREFRRVMPGGLNGMPQTFLLDTNGKVVYHKRKYRPGDEEVLYDQARALLN